MHIGHITLNSRSTSTGDYACQDCGENFSETGSYQDSCDDHFGGHSWWVECCPHCGGEDVFEGKIFLHKKGESVARKDHLNDKGKVIIPKGSSYKWELMKGYKVNEKSYEHEGFYYYNKYRVRN